MNLFILLRNRCARRNRKHSREGIFAVSSTALALLAGATQPLEAGLLAGNTWPNSSLESISSQAGIPTHWSKGGSAPSMDDWATDFSVSPTHSLKLEDTSESDYGEWWSERVKITAGATYSLRYQLRYDTVGPMRVTVNFADSTGVRTGGVDFTFSDTQLDWEEVTQSFTAPDGAKAMWLTFASGGSLAVTGTAWLDDISLVNESGETGGESNARILDAAYSTDLKIDGDLSDWTSLASGMLTMDTQGRGTHGTLAVDMQYAWNYTNLYLLVKENPSYTVAQVQQEAADGVAYQGGPWSVDSIAFWMDLDNNAGTVADGKPVTENNADFQPWFGFSSAGRTDLFYGRLNDSGTMNLEGLQNAKVATGGTFAQHNRRIEIQIAWADVGAAVDPSRQPAGDITKAIAPDFVFGSEPLLVYKDYNSQAFLGPDQWNPPSGVDTNSVDVRLVSGAKVIDATYRSSIRVDGDGADWSGLNSGVITMDTQGRGTAGLLTVDIQYAWDMTNLYVLVQENARDSAAAVQQEATGATDYQAAPWNFDSIAFWFDLDNDAGTLQNGLLVVEQNADFQPWFGFSTAGRTNLFYARVNNSDSKNLAGLSHARVATGGSFAQHDRRIEVAIAWADMAAAVSQSRQPGGDITQAVKAGFTFGSEPLLVYNDYNAQAFIGPDQWNAPSGVDVHSRDIRLVEAAVAGETPTITIRSAGRLVELLWPASAEGFALETSPRLGGGAVWSKFDGVVSVENGTSKATVTPSAAAAFYRLHK